MLRRLAVGVVLRTLSPLGIADAPRLALQPLPGRLGHHGLTVLEVDLLLGDEPARHLGDEGVVRVAATLHAAHGVGALGQERDQLQRASLVAARVDADRASVLVEDGEHAGHVPGHAVALVAVELVGVASRVGVLSGH